MQGCTCNVRLEDRVSEELRALLKLNSVKGFNRTEDHNQKQLFRDVFQNRCS